MTPDNKRSDSFRYNSKEETNENHSKNKKRKCVSGAVLISALCLAGCGSSTSGGTSVADTTQKAQEKVTSAPELTVTPMPTATPELTATSMPTATPEPKRTLLIFEIYNNEAMLTKWRGDSVSVTIPQKVDGYPVTSIGNEAFSECSSLNSVTIPESVTSIGNGAFEDCSNLKLIVTDGSYAQKYADENGIPYVTE